MPTFDTPEPITATIVVVAADVRISLDDRTTTTVDVQPSDPSDHEDVRAAEGTRVELASGQLLVKAPKLRSWLPRPGGGSINVTIALPAGSRVNASGQLADFHLDGQAGDCRIRTALGRIHVDGARTVNLKSASGDVSLEHASGDADLAVASGDIRARRLDGAAVVKNSNGEAWIGVAAGGLRVKSANGSAVIERAEADVSAKSANGDLRVDDVVRGSVTLVTHAGEIEVGIHEGTAAWLEVSSAAGRVHNELDAAASPGATGEKAEVRARTSLGDIVVRRAQPAVAPGPS